MLRKIPSKARINETEVRYKTRLEDDPCVPDSHESRLAQFVFIRTLVETPDLLSCGPVPFKKMVIFHDGDRWVADAEAVVEEPAEPARRT